MQHSAEGPPAQHPSSIHKGYCRSFSILIFTCNLSAVDTHLSIKVHIDWLSPRDQTLPLLSTSLPAKRLDHSHEALPSLVACRKSEVGKYKPFKTCAHNAFSSYSSLAAELANNAEFNEFSSLNPNPPSFFATIIASHIFQWIFWFPLFAPYQNFAIMEFISSHHVVGRLDTLFT